MQFDSEHEGSIWDGPSTTRNEGFRLACCMCREPVPYHSDVYALDAEWQRRYPTMVGVLACQRCALDTNWSCRQRDGLTYVDGHIPAPHGRYPGRDSTPGATSKARAPTAQWCGSIRSPVSFKALKTTSAALWPGSLPNAATPRSWRRFRTRSHAGTAERYHDRPNIDIRHPSSLRGAPASAGFVVCAILPAPARRPSPPAGFWAALVSAARSVRASSSLVDHGRSSFVLVRWVQGAPHAATVAVSMVRRTLTERRRQH